MRTIRRHRMLISLLAVLALVVVACGDSDTEEATPIEIPSEEAPPIEIPGTAATATFDLEESVAVYLATIPEGYMAVGDLTAFKDAVDVGAMVIDVREADEYAVGHLPGAINIPLRTIGTSLDMIPMDRQVFVYCQSGYRAALATSALHMLGYDNVLSFPPSYSGWTAAGEPVTTEVVAAESFGMPTIEPMLLESVGGFLAGIPEGFMSAGDVSKVKEAMGAGAFMLDVRSDAEWGDGRIPGATHFELRSLSDHLSEIPTDRTVITYCKSGHRAALAAAALQVLGFDNVEAFPASYGGWVEAGEAIES